MAKSMTQGSPIKLMMQFALPLLVGNLLQQTYNIIDAVIVGKTLGADALAGVGASSSIQFLVLGFCMGCCTGFGVPVAKYFGANDLGRMRRYIYNGAVLTAVIAVIVTAVCALLCHQILRILSVPGDIYDMAYDYLIVIFLGIPFTLMYNFLSGVLRSVGDSRTPFIFLAVSAVINIFLDLFCILVLGWGCAGAAIATIASQAISAVACLIFIVRRVKLLWLTASDRRMERAAVSELLGMGLPTGLQFSITAIGSMVMQSANNKLGSIYVSGFTAGMKIKQFAMCPFDAIGTAASVFCSQNYGAGQSKRIRQGLREGILVAVGYGVLIGLVLIFAGRPLSTMFISSDSASALDVDAVLDASGKYLRCLGMFYWSLGILNISRMVTQGLGYSGRAIFSGVTEMLARIIVSIGFAPVYGFTAICFADQTAWVTACFYILPTCLVCVRKATKKIESGEVAGGAKTA